MGGIGTKLETELTRSQISVVLSLNLTDLYVAELFVTITCICVVLDNYVVELNFVLVGLSNHDWSGRRDPTLVVDSG